jgi:hypothetical protein
MGTSVERPLRFGLHCANNKTPWKVRELPRALQGAPNAVVRQRERRETSEQDPVPLTA